MQSADHPAPCCPSTSVLVDDIKTYWTLLSRPSLSVLLSAAVAAQIGDAVIELSLVSLFGWWNEAAGIDLLSISLVLLTKMTAKLFFEPIGGVIAITCVLLLLLRQSSSILFMAFIHFSLAALFPNALKLELPQSLNTINEFLPACFLESLSWGFLPSLGIQLAGILLSFFRWEVAAGFAPLFYALGLLLILYGPRARDDPSAAAPVTESTAQTATKTQTEESQEVLLQSESSPTDHFPSTIPLSPPEDRQPSESDEQPPSCLCLLGKLTDFTKEGVLYVLSNRYILCMCCLKAAFCICSSFQDAILLRLALESNSDSGAEYRRPWLVGVLSVTGALAFASRALLTTLVVDPKRMIESVISAFVLMVIANAFMVLATFLDGNPLLLIFVSVIRGASQNVVYVCSTYLLYASADPIAWGRVFAFESASAASTSILCLLAIAIAGTVQTPLLEASFFVMLLSIFVVVVVAWKSKELSRTE